MEVPRFSGGSPPQLSICILLFCLLHPGEKIYLNAYCSIFSQIFRLLKGRANDAVGNRLSESTATGTTTYSYNIANRLTCVDDVTYILHFVQDRLPQGMRDRF